MSRKWSGIFSLITHECSGRRRSRFITFPFATTSLKILRKLVQAHMDTRHAY